MNLIEAFALHFFFEALVVHDSLEKHAVLILKAFPLLLQQAFNLVFLFFFLRLRFKVTPDIDEIDNFILD